MLLDGPVVACEGAPKSAFAMRLSSVLHTDVLIRYLATGHHSLGSISDRLVLT